MPSIEWTFNTNTLLLSAIASGVFGTGGLFYIKENRRAKDVDVTKTIQGIANTMVQLQQVQIERQEEKIAHLDSELAKSKDERYSLREDMLAFREYLLSDAEWHRQVTAELGSMGVTVKVAPILPPSQRVYSRTNDQTS